VSSEPTADTVGLEVQYIVRPIVFLKKLVFSLKNITLRVYMFLLYNRKLQKNIQDALFLDRIGFT